METVMFYVMAKIDNVLKNFENEDDLIPALQAVQDEFGFLSEENISNVADHLQMPLVNIYGVATFYTMFKFKPRGKYVISVCRGTACHVHNSLNLLKYLEKKLNLKSGESNKEYSLQSVNCIGACAKAPAIMINDEVYGNMDEKGIDKILAELK